MTVCRRAGLAVACAILGVTTQASTARAGDNASEGERLFREGRALMLEGSFDEACPKLAESQAIDPHVGTLLNLAACHERQGKVASAWVEYQKALTAARTEGQAERARLAQERIEALAPRVPWLTVSVAEGVSENVVVTLDGAVLQRVALGKEMPVDPGPHTVEANRESRKPFEQRFELGEGERRTIALADFTELPAPEAKPETIIVDPNPKDSAREARASKPSRWLFEPGVFVGYVSLGNSAQIGNRSYIELQGADGTRSNCATANCSYSASRNGAVAGVNVFAGYAISERAHFGGRLLAGPGLEGGLIAAFGPSISFEVTEAFWLGAWTFLGAATVSSRGYAYTPQYGSTDATISYEAGGLGGGLEASLRLLTLPHGRLLANVTPLFMIGDSSAWSLPFGVSYRFE